MAEFVGRVDSVFTRQFSASIESAASAGASTLTVVDGDDLDPAGQLQTPWDGAIYDYTFDGDVTVTLTTPLATAADAGEIVLVWDPATGAPVVDTVAHVAVLGVDNADDIVEARVSFPLIPLLSEGIRTEENAEAVTVRTDGSDYVVAEVLGQAAVMSAEFVNEVLVPQLPPLGGDSSDGLTPAANPVIAVRSGIGSLFLTWDPVDNPDRVTYDVYAVPASDSARLAAPPLETDLAGSTDATGVVIRALPGGALLSPEASYAVAVYARDADGQCAVSATPVTASPAKVNSEDLALNALTTAHLTANDALFEALQAQTITGVEIEGDTFRTDAGNRRIEIGPVSTETGGGRIDFYSPDLDRPATVIASTEGTLGITSGGDLDGGGVAQSALIDLAGVGPFSTVTTAAVEAASVSVINSGSRTVATGLIQLRADSTLKLEALNTVDIDATTLVDIDAPTITLGRTSAGLPLLELKNDGTYYLRGSNLDGIGKTARSRSTAAQSIAHNTETNLTFNATDGAPYFPRGTWFSYASGVFTCLVDGFYTVNAGVYFASGAAGTRRILAIDKNNSRMMRNDNAAKGTAAAACGVAVSASLPMVEGDILEIVAYQDSGAALSTSTGFSGSCAVLEITRAA